MDRLKGRNLTQDNNIRGFTPYPYQWTDLPDRVKQENSAFKWNIRPDRFNRFIQKIPSKCSRIHILLSSAQWNTLKDGHILWYKSINKFKNEIISIIFSSHNGIKLETNYKGRKLEK